MSATATTPTYADRVFSPEEVAEHLGCTRMTVYRLLKAGKLRSFRIGSAWRVSESALAEFIEVGTGTVTGRTVRHAGPEQS